MGTVGFISTRAFSSKSSFVIPY